MNLAHMAAARADEGRPIRVGLIGAGKFGSMFLSQVPTTKGLEVAVIADLDPDRARRSCAEVGWREDYIKGVDFTDDSSTLFTRSDVEVVVEATGNPAVGVDHALMAIEHGKHIIMVNVEADVLAGAYLADA
ncbi:MAG: Gfo/Idh/MocA family oxidoreductase, partial [Alphaproteobacteria bacterium]